MSVTLPVVAFAVLSSAAFVAGPPGLPEMLPHPTAYRMANQARAVVEGTVDKDGVVTITERFWVKPGDQLGAKIRVPALRNIDKGKVRPDSVVLFLDGDPQDGAWQPMHCIGKGARGVIWLAGKLAWGYGQRINPGGYTVTRWGNGWGRQRVDVSPQQLRQELRAGVVARKQWNAVAAIEDPGERAAALVRWFDPATSPDGERWRERMWPDLQQAVDAVGAPIVKPLARMVKIAADPEVVVAAGDALARLGRTAQPATPAFIARLRDLRGVQPIFLVRSLRNLCDPRAADVLRDYIAHEDLFVATAAAKALHAAGGRDVVERLVPRVPKAIDSPQTLSVVSSMLEVIHDLDPKTGERLVIERFLAEPQLMMQRPWLRRIRDTRR